LIPQVSDMLDTALTGLFVESEAGRHGRRREQGELLEFVRFVHENIMTKGCDTHPR